MKINPADLPDEQANRDYRGISLPKVGIRKVYLPLRITIEDGTSQVVSARVSAYTNLNAKVKGINMSRILEVIQPIFELGLSLKDRKGEIFLEKILTNLVARLGSQDSYIQIGFKLFLPKSAPISEKIGYSHYDVKFSGTFYENRYQYFMETRVQYISCCSCSKALTKHLQKKLKVNGAPHNQRSFADVKVELDPTNPIGLIQLISGIEQATFTLPYPIIKRNDEQEVARRSWNHTQFCEDAVREIGRRLSCANILDWVVVVNHEETIHQHNAIAILYKGKSGGLR